MSRYRCQCCWSHCSKKICSQTKTNIENWGKKKNGGGDRRRIQTLRASTPSVQHQRSTSSDTGGEEATSTGWSLTNKGDGGKGFPLRPGVHKQRQMGLQSSKRLRMDPVRLPGSSVRLVEDVPVTNPTGHVRSHFSSS